MADERSWILFDAFAGAEAGHEGEEIRPLTALS
jgi:hypothetical protein